jgi:hypothetical protein
MSAAGHPTPPGPSSPPPTSTPPRVQRSGIGASPANGFATVTGARVQRSSTPAATPGSAAGPDGGVLDPATTSRIQRASGRGASLDSSLRPGLESALGADLGNVNIHADSPLPAEVGAVAFTAVMSTSLPAGTGPTPPQACTRSATNWPTSSNRVAQPRPHLSAGTSIGRQVQGGGQGRNAAGPRQDHVGDRPADGGARRSRWAAATSRPGRAASTERSTSSRTSGRGRTPRTRVARSSAPHSSG